MRARGVQSGIAPRWKRERGRIWQAHSPEPCDNTIPDSSHRQLQAIDRREMK